MQHIHILGIAGTFMGSLAQIAKSLGFRVTGQDQAVYPPMSTQLANANIDFIEGYEPDFIASHSPDLVIVGNVVSRGNAAIEYVLDKKIRYTSGPQWLSETVLQDRWVLAVSGTHGKTTTASLLTWLLADNGFEPGYLIGGVPTNFDRSASLGKSDFFVIEADEYDSAFFDKRSKFLHYKPDTLVINNLEYDHADIFPDLAAIQTQFHHLVRTVPNRGLIIAPTDISAIEAVLARGVWTDLQWLGRDWTYRLVSEDGSQFEVFFGGEAIGTVNWSLTGMHNVANAMAAIAAARHVGLEPQHAVASLSRFSGVKRRMELLDTVGSTAVYDDFAHHPTAIETTLQGARARVGQGKILAIIEPRSNTMKQGVHKASLKNACEAADTVVWLETGEYGWRLADIAYDGNTEHVMCANSEAILQFVANNGLSYEAIIVMSNGGFGGIHSKIIQALKQSAEQSKA